MKVRYFHVDEADRVHKVAQRHMVAAWQGDRPWDGSRGLRDLRIVTILCREGLIPIRSFLFRAATEDGWITESSRREVMQTRLSLLPDPLVKEHRPAPNPLLDAQFADWPDLEELIQQLAVAIDVPVSAIPAIYWGGPLITATQLSLTVPAALEYYRGLC